MKLFDLVTKNRSYRGYDENCRMTREDLMDLVELARRCPSSVNMQPLKFRIVTEQKELDVVQPLTGWARRLPERNLPDPGHHPTAFMIICQDKRIAENTQRFWKDVGIVAQTILLGAVEKGFGGIMIGNFTPEKISSALLLEDYFEPVLILALGKPDETVILEDVGTDGDIGYYRDEQDRHHVPKRKAEDLVIKELSKNEGHKKKIFQKYGGYSSGF